MRRIALLSWLLSCVLVVACTSKDATPDPIYDLAGRDLIETGPGDGSPATGEEPVITVTTPSDLTKDIPGSLLQLVVQVTSPVNRSISTVSVLVDGSPEAMLTSTGNNIYGGSVDISAAGAMPMMTITAIDSAKVTSQLKATLHHDRGPVITFLQPTAETAHGTVNVRVKIVDALYPTIAPADVVAEIRAPNDVTLTLVPGTGVGMVPPEFDGTVNFNSAAFTPALTGPQEIKVTAKNSKGTSAFATKAFAVDNAGPAVTIIKPVAGNFVGGLTSISATVQDALSGVNNATVMAVFAGSVNFQVPLTLSTTEVNTYTGLFDIHKLGTGISFPVLTVSADDKLGNHTDSSIILKIDNTPPILSMDPPKMRVAIKNGANKIQCSVLFDPVGDESVNDGFNPATPIQVISVKARVEDRANHATGQLVDYIAGIDPATVRLVAIPAPAGSTPILAVDIDGDSYCDDVNPALVQAQGGGAMTAAQYIQVGMAQVTKLGTPDYFSPGAPLAAGCEQMGDPALTQPPPLLCASSGTYLTYTLPYTDPAVPAIWTLPPVTDTNAGCIGLQFDTLNRLPEGPACLAVAATDLTGNKSISAPLRICVRRSSGGPCDTFTAPECTGTYDPTAQVTSNVPCTPRKFAPSGEIRYLLN